MNAGGRASANPIENICYTRTPPAGTYKVYVHFFRRKTTVSEIPYTLYVRNGSSEQYFRGVHTTQKEKHLVYEFTYPE
jgi:hypothetical protein